MKKYSKFLAVLLAVAMILPGLAQAGFAAEGLEVKRLSGDNRSLTSIEVSKEVYKDGANAVVLAGYGGSADALTGTLLAATKDAPLLVVAKAGVTSELKAEIARLGATKVYILGGETAVPASVKTDLEALELTVERVNGDNRYATAAKVAEGAANAENVFLALGRAADNGALADALAIGPVSAKNGMPVLLTRTDKLPEETVKALKDLGVKNVTIIGGVGAVSAAVKAELEALGLTVDRVGGANRYETSALIAAKYFDKPASLILANGRVDFDALVGGYLGVKKNAPVLLTRANSLADETKAYMEANRLDTYVLGGKSVVEEAVVTEAEAVLAGEEVEDLKVVSVSAINSMGELVTLDGATNIDVNSKMVIKFPVEMDNQTLNANTVKLVEASGAQAPGNYAYNGFKSELTFVPAAPLKDDVKYTLTVTTDVKSKDDKSFSENKTSFTTGSKAAVAQLIAGGTTIVNDGDRAVFGNNVVDANEVLTLRFNKDMDPNTINTTNIKLYDESNARYVTGSLTATPYNPATRTATFTIGAGEASVTNAILRVEASNLKTLAGGEVSNFKRSFTVGTQATPALQTVLGAQVYPKLQSATINNTYYQGFKLTYTFNRDMDASTINGTTVQIREQGSMDAIDTTINFDKASNTLTVTPKNDLKEEQAYTVFFDNEQIKDGNGIAITTFSSSFTTGDYSRPEVVKTTPANAANNVEQDQRITIDFDEAVAAPTIANAVVNQLSNTQSIILIDSNNVGFNLNGRVSRDNSNKSVVINTTGLNLQRNTTYTVKLRGGDKTAAIVDTSVATGGLALAQDYEFSFTTVAADTTAPRAEKVLVGSTYANAKEVAKDAKNVDSTKNLYIVFDELLDNTTAPITADNLGNATDDVNVVIERRASGATAWTQVPYGNAAAAVTDDLQAKKTYITIGAAQVANDFEYRVRILPTVGGGVVQDLAGNDLATTYTFGFTTDGTLGFTPVTTGDVMAGRTVTTAVSATGSNTITTAAAAPSNGDVIAVTQNDGSYFFTTSTAVAGGAITIADALPTSGGGVANGAEVTNLTTHTATFANLEASRSVSTPKAIVINGSASAPVDVNTVDSTTVKLTKNDGTVVDASIKAKIINNNAYVSINPTSDLDVNTQYKVTVEGVKDRLGNTIDKSSTSFVTATAALEDLKIDSVNPANNTGNVAVDGSFEINFNSAPTSIITVVPNATAAAGQVAIKDAAGNYLATTDVNVQLSNAGKTVKLTPNSFLVQNTTYVVEVHSATTNGTGTLGTTKSYSFRTENVASKTPQIVGAKLLDANTNGLGDATERILITFNTAVNGGTFDVTDLTVGNGGNLDDSTATLSADGKSAIVTLANGNNLLAIIKDVTTITVDNTATPITANGVGFSDSISVTIK